MPVNKICRCSWINHGTIEAPVHSIEPEDGQQHTYISPDSPPVIDKITGLPEQWAWDSDPSESA